VGPRLHQPTPEEDGVNEKLDRLAELLRQHPPDRLDLFWSDVMAKRPPIDPSTISGQLKLVIRDSGLTHYAIGKAAGVAPDVILRFMVGERTLTLRTLDKIAGALRLRLCQVADDSKGDA
jgi:hypothetical protein